MQPINRVLLILLVAGSGFYFWRKQQNQVEYDRQVGALASSLDRRFLSPNTPSSQAESMFRRALVILSDYRSLVARRRVTPPEVDYLRDALGQAGYSSDFEISIVSKSLRDNLEVCDRTKIISEPEGLQSLLTGQAPVIRGGPSKGDLLVIGRRVAPALAPEVINHPANFTMLPSSAAALMWPYTLSDATMSAIGEFQTLNLIDSKTAADLKQRSGQLRSAKP